MRLSIDLFIALCYAIRLVNCKETYFYEKMNNFGLGNPIIPRPNEMNHRRSGFMDQEQYPRPLPTMKRSPIAAMHSPYKRLYQGSRVVNDTRVYRRNFQYSPKDSGHQVLCEGMFDCTITHMAIETTEAIPVILRGGAGYRYFMVIVKAKPGYELKGTVRAYCKKKQVLPVVPDTDMPLGRPFINLTEQ